MKQVLSFPRSLFVAAVLMVLGQAALVHATVVVALSRAELTQRSARVVRATVGAQRSMWNEDHSQIITLTTLQVRETWRGAPATSLTLRQFGGEEDGIASTIPGDAHLSPGQDVVLFLRERNGAVFLTSLAQSAYLVDSSHGTPTVARDLSELSFATRDANQVLQLAEAASDANETLSHLRADVIRISGGAR